MHGSWLTPFILSKCSLYLKTIETTNVRRMADLVALFHVRPFLQSRLASMAPASDLEYFALMSKYEDVEEKVAKVAFTSICNHLWYFSDELVVLSMFDESLPGDLKQQMVDKLLSITPPKNFATGKPIFLTIDLDATDYPQQLFDFIGPRSWLNSFSFVKSQR